MILKLIIAGVRIAVKFVPFPFNLLADLAVTIVEDMDLAYLICRLPEVVCASENPLPTIFKEYLRDVFLLHPFMPIPQYFIDKIRQQM